VENYTSLGESAKCRNGTEGNVGGCLSGRRCKLIGADFVAVRHLVVPNVRRVDHLPSSWIGGRNVRGVRLGSRIGGNRLVLEEVRRGSRGSVVGSNAQNLSRVNVEAVFVDVGVIVIKLGRIDSLLRFNPHTGITWRNDVGGLAVSAFRTQANRLTRHKVAAAVIDGGVVDGHDLVGGCMLFSTDGIASVPRLDSVLTSTGIWHHPCGDAWGEQWKGAEGGNDEGSEHGRLWGYFWGLKGGMGYRRMCNPPDFVRWAWL